MDTNKAITQMVSFIKQEAQEKAQEINIKAEEEFNIEKLRLVEEQKVKVKAEFDRKLKQVEIQKRIAFSNEVNASRLRVLTSRDEVVNQVKTVVMNELNKLGDASAPGYKEMCQKLVLQGLYQLMEPAVVVRCRKSDQGVVQGVLKDAANQFTNATGNKCDVTLDKDFLPDKNDPTAPCAGGVKLYTPDHMICCDNTLNARLDVVLSQKLPDVKIALFGRSASRVHIDVEM
ncbi:vacuolar ATP synthase subunit [Guillardia theta CCMP2712]|uniref:Vacuolar ATP synthase subunit n=1 Tax=Guillardia theta (strain CCMP2712) TaxID=905079 RepID=L1IH33_GUITC|nr:vacuolar ATP synthase subunit [Guillardia theta CCMP2712]EKX35382.1 vacuolar ATP synthase subunit [Guillardia theta CCMP2712]|eukprot:XP_005822362.1 vacuolar ATP synthase subunit [Guillardia theta CCMP2712]